MFIALLSSFIYLLVDTPAYQSVIDAVKSSLNETTLSSVLVYAMGLAVVLYLFWWSARKVLSILRKAFARGKLRL